MQIRLYFHKNAFTNLFLLNNLPVAKLEPTWQGGSLWVLFKIVYDDSAN